MIDDARGLPIWLRLLVQSAAGLAALRALPVEGLFFSSAMLLAIVWASNLYNFMDGADGLAGGMSVIGFTGYAIAAADSGQVNLALLSTAVAGASAGFLMWNFAPARIFLGDVGSVPLGFLAATIGAAGWRLGSWSLVFPLVLFSPFILDASLTLTRRLLAGKKVWEAHRDHLYQRLIRAGWGHRGLAVRAYGLMLVMLLLALLSRQLEPEALTTLLVGVAAAYIALIVASTRYLAARQPESVR